LRLSPISGVWKVKGSEWMKSPPTSFDTLGYSRHPFLWQAAHFIVVGAWAAPRMCDAEAIARHVARRQAAIQILTNTSLSLRDPFAV
jgi:hypothetical protein